MAADVLLNMLESKVPYICCVTTEVSWYTCTLTMQKKLEASLGRSPSKETKYAQLRNRRQRCKCSATPQPAPHTSNSSANTSETATQQGSIKHGNSSADEGRGCERLRPITAVSPCYCLGCHAIVMHIVQHEKIGLAGLRRQERSLRNQRPLFHDTPPEILLALETHKPQWPCKNHSGHPSHQLPG